MTKSIIVAGAVGAAILGTVALAQTTTPSQTTPPPITDRQPAQDNRTSTPPDMTGQDTDMTRREVNPGTSANNNASSGYGAGAQTSSTATPYSAQSEQGMMGGAQTSARDGTASQWAGERG
ncbi:hypothetical protein D3C72_561840 [compost metagenome]